MKYDRNWKWTYLVKKSSEKFRSVPELQTFLLIGVKSDFPFLFTVFWISRVDVSIFFYISDERKNSSKRTDMAQIPKIHTIIILRIQSFTITSKAYIYNCVPQMLRILFPHWITPKGQKVRMVRFTAKSRVGVKRGILHNLWDLFSWFSPTMRSLPLA